LGAISLSEGGKLQIKGLQWMLAMLATDLTRPQQSSKPMATCLFSPSTIVVPLIVGIAMIAAGIALMGSILGLAFLVIGVVSFAGSFAGRRQFLVFLYLPGESAAIALYIAVEFLAGVALGFIGGTNIAFDSEALDWSLVAIFIFGLLLVTDSFLLYRRGFKQDLGNEKGV
jgi:fumarate reductase subunit D